MNYSVALTPLAGAYLEYRCQPLELTNTMPNDILLWTAWHIVMTPKIFIYAGAREMLGSDLTHPVTINVTYRHNTRKKELLNAYERILWSKTIETEFTKVMYREILECNSPTKVVVEWQERLGLDESEFSCGSHIRTYYNRLHAKHPLTT